MNQMTVDQFAKIRQANEYVLVDVREPQEIDICSLPEHLNYPLSAGFDQYLTLDRERLTIVMCHHGVRSAYVTEFLANNGFGQVVNLEGGIDAWARQIDPSVPTY